LSSERPRVQSARSRSARGDGGNAWLVPGGLIVSDIEAAHKEIVARGIKRKGRVPRLAVLLGRTISGPDPERQSYRSYVSFEDPDENVWIVQEVTRRLPGRVDPATMTFASAKDMANAIPRAAAAHGEHE